MDGAATRKRPTRVAAGELEVMILCSPESMGIVRSKIKEVKGIAAK
jgi:hypothetical protein